MKKKFLLKTLNGDLIEEDSKEFNPKAFREKVLSLSILRNDKVSGDGFKPHYSKELGGWISTRGQFEQKCKEKGFSCAGSEKPPQYKESKSSSGLNDSDIKELSQKEGISFTKKEAEFVKSI